MNLRERVLALVDDTVAPRHAGAARRLALAAARLALEHAAGVCERGHACKPARPVLRTEDDAYPPSAYGLGAADATRCNQETGGPR